MWSVIFGGGLGALYSEVQCMMTTSFIGSFLDSIEHDFIRIWKYETVNTCLMDQYQTCKPVMVSVVSSSPTGGNYLRHLDANFVQKWQKRQICVIYEWQAVIMVDRVPLQAEAIVLVAGMISNFFNIFSTSFLISAASGYLLASFSLYWHWTNIIMP